VESYETDADFDDGLVVTGRPAPGVQFLDDFDAGRRIFESRFAPIAESVREHLKVPENPLGKDPSADPVEFLGQVADMVRDVSGNPTEVAKQLAKLVAGSAFESARVEQRAETAAKRAPLYEAAAEGLAAGLDPHHGTKPQADAERQALFDRMHDAASRLSDTEKDQLGIYLVQHYRGGRLDSAEDRPEDALADTVEHLDGNTFERAASSMFRSWHYSWD
jgi:hypothetical protein